jgi:hypothetical protein
MPNLASSRLLLDLRRGKRLEAFTTSPVAGLVVAIAMLNSSLSRCGSAH